MRIKYIHAYKINHDQDSLEIYFADIREVHPGCFVILLKWDIHRGYADYSPH